MSSAVPPSSFTTDVDMWTLDSLFLTPANRLKYYKKLYSRLLKSTQPGRSDHALLVGANERLVQLLGRLDSRATIVVGSEDDVAEASPPPPPPRDVPLSTPRVSSTPAPNPERAMSPNAVTTPSQQFQHRTPANGVLSSERGSLTESVSSGQTSRGPSGRDSQQSAKTSNSSPPSERTSNSMLNSPITDLERRLSTERVLDIFTMAPKVC